jgi:hypothetical protein
MQCNSEFSQPEFNLQLFADEVSPTGTEGIPPAAETAITTAPITPVVNPNPLFSQEAATEAITSPATADTTAETDKPPVTDVVTPPVTIDYKINVPEGYNAPTEDFISFAKENGLSNETAQAAVDFYINKVVPTQQKAVTDQVTTWEAETKKTYGDAGIEIAKKAVNTFATPELIEILNQSGLGNHPQIVGLFKSIGEKISESTLVNGTASQIMKDKASLLFGTK